MVAGVSVARRVLPAHLTISHTAFKIGRLFPADGKVPRLRRLVPVLDGSSDRADRGDESAVVVLHLEAPMLFRL